MHGNPWQKNRILALAIAVILAASPVLASKYKWDGDSKKSNKHQQEEQYEHHGDSHGEQHGSLYFDDHRRNVINNYYAEQFRAGHCPSGLAKKHNGCMPPGQAKRWQLGKPLPGDVIFHNLPDEVVVQLGPPPIHHRYVRVANDILMIAVGTGMVVDAIEDIGRY